MAWRFGRRAERPRTGVRRGIVAAAVAAAVVAAAGLAPARRQAVLKSEAIPVGTPLLAGVAWMGDGTLVAAGKDGQAWSVDLTTKAAAVAAKGSVRVRVLLGQPIGRQFLAARDDGTASVWFDGRAWGDKLRSSRAIAGDPAQLAGPVPAPGPRRAVLFASAGAIFRWDPTGSSADDPVKVAEAALAGPGTLAVVARTKGANRGPRAAWAGSAGAVVLSALDAGDPAKAARGIVRTPERALAVAPTPDGDAFDVLAPSGAVRRYAFPEDRAASSLTKTAFPKKVLASAVAGAGGWVVVAGDDRNVYRVPIDPAKDEAPTPSAAAVHDGSDPSRKATAVAVAADGARVVALLDEGAGASQLNRVLDLAAFPAGASWREDTADVKAAVPGSLAVSDSGKAAALVATPKAGGDPTLFRIDLAAATPPVPVTPPATGGTPDFDYKGTGAVAFLPGSDDTWILPTGAAGAPVVLRLVAWNGTAATSVPIFTGPMGVGLAAPPGAISDGAGGVLIASAWDDGKVRVQSLNGTTAKDVGSADTAALGAVKALALAKVSGAFRLAAQGANWIGVFDPSGRAFEVERLDAPGVPPLAWRGTDLVTASVDGSGLVTLASRALGFVKDFSPGSSVPAPKAAAILGLNTKTLAALGNDTAAAVVDLSAPGLVAALPSPPKAKALEFLSEGAVALLDDDGRVVVYRSDGAAMPSFTALPPWSPGGGAKVASVRRVDEGHLLATLDSGDEIPLAVPAAGASGPLAAGPSRAARGLGAPAVVGGSPAPWSVGFEASGSTTRLRARLAVPAGIAPLTDYAAPSPASPVTAAAWPDDSSGGGPPLLGLADGRLWAPDTNPASSRSFDPPAGLPKTAQVAALAGRPGGALAAVAWTQDGNNLRLRDRAAPATDLVTPLDAGAAPTAVAFSPDGTWLAAGTLAGGVRLWRVKGEAPPAFDVPIDLDASPAAVAALAFAPDGASGRLAAIDVRGNVTAWGPDARMPPAPTARLAPTLNLDPAPGDRTYRLAWKPDDGSALAVASQKGTIFLVTPP
jgi:hypothetical protein